MRNCSECNEHVPSYQQLPLCEECLAEFFVGIQTPQDTISVNSRKSQIHDHNAKFIDSYKSFEGIALIV